MSEINKVVMHKETGQLCLITNVIASGKLMVFLFLLIDEDNGTHEWNNMDYELIGDLE